MLLPRHGKSWFVFIIISLVIQNADSWDRNHSLVFITNEIRVLYCSLHIFALNFWLQWWPVNCNFKALLLQPDLVSNGASPNFIARIGLSLEDFPINIGNGDQTTPGRAQKWLFLFPFLQKLPVEKGLCIFSVLTPSKQGHRQISYIRIAEYLKYSIFRGGTPVRPDE